MKPTSKRAAAPVRPVRPAVRFKAEIERATAEGVALEDMALHLTLGDVEQLKRDRTVAMADINFRGGTMTYLGVKVVKGDGGASVLRREAAAAV